MKPFIFHPKTWLPGCLLLLTYTLHAQQPFTVPPRDMKPLTVGTVERLYSQTLGEYRELNVYTPEGYHPDSVATYPVIYLLDGTANEDFLHIAGIVQFMYMMDLFTPHILVGIANTGRRQDFTHPSTDANDLKLIPNSGGSEKFIGFLGEAKQYVDSYYRTTRHSTLIGQSLGGLLATEILLKHPQAFSRYIIVSPSLWWGKGALLASAAEKIKAWPAGQHPAEVYIAVGKEGHVMEKDAAQLAQVLKAANIKGLNVHFEEFPKETHATILHNAVYQTLLKIKQ